MKPKQLKTYAKCLAQYHRLNPSLRMDGFWIVGAQNDVIVATGLMSEST